MYVSVRERERERKPEAKVVGLIWNGTVTVSEGCEPMVVNNKCVVFI